MTERTMRQSRVTQNSKILCHHIDNISKPNNRDVDSPNRMEAEGGHNKNCDRSRNNGGIRKTETLSQRENISKDAKNIKRQVRYVGMSVGN